ncbi:type I DNA topoisomerase [Candidatus Babeliales bacterium]|nr:type I DNA topoisomerase [Candidatus Babeliales bacterium]MBP9843800.1 type I DNA topoisomerase [Candidatus Babeliales bacterium]
MKKLLIVESPAKIKTIAKFLGNEFTIMSTVGHIKDLPKKTLGITMGKTIELEYVTIDKKDKVIKDLVKEAKNSDEIYLAPDPDREGEIIAWHAEQEILKVAKPENIYRISFNEITKSAITEAISKPSHVDLKKVAAQQARRVLDRWVGYEVSPILWRKITKGLSAGRVQSVALKIICLREMEIRSFKIEEYWSIESSFTTPSHEKISAMLTHISKKAIEIDSQEKVDKVVEAIKNEQFAIESINDKKRTKNPVAPFITSTLQQAGANKLNFPVKKIMSLAQNMYEGVALGDPRNPVALITYMRTDSTRLSQTAIDQAREFIPHAYGKEYLPATANIYSQKNAAQDAHEAIRPIDVNVTPEDIKPYVESDIYKLYNLIWTRFIACQMKPALYAQRQIVIQGGKFTFKVTGSTLLFDGFLKAYQSEDEEEDKNVKVPQDINEKDSLGLSKVDPKQHFTQPPPRYSEATLVKELEKLGIGRPSTYATILSTIQARTYVTIEKKRFIPTELGSRVTEMLSANLPKIMDTQFTALMEEDLDKVAQGDMDRDALLREFYASFSQDLEKFKGDTTKQNTIPTDVTCPQCDAQKLVIRIGKTGEFIGCPGFPECKFTSNFTRQEDGTIVLVETKEPELLAETCPNCTKPLRLMKGRFGEFTACSGYPACKYIKQNIAPFPCPQCNGNLVERKWRGGKFWGCGKYPTCKFAIFADIENRPCPTCKAPYLLKKNTKEGVMISCSEKTCSYKEQHEHAPKE